MALSEDLLRRLKVIAAQQDSSISAMLTEALHRVADEELGYAEARRSMLADLRKGFPLGTKGKIAWRRESLHERPGVRRH